ncbi:hypothetical protein N9N67_01405 [Bacteriovoracaceae bacterium]|nr:hypothetical protein [Bacteriovoracaceae bacterium]
MAKSLNKNYSTFDKINGKHPLKKAIPSGHIDYDVRCRPGGKVRYFNFDLAREIGLIPKNHPNKLYKELSDKILHTFGLIIINEYDKNNGKVFPVDQIKPNKYMATRYLQLQHKSRTGKTSGDGRSIWNGSFLGNDSKYYDFSSCGTGATKLSPATSKFNKFFESGDPSISYGCGYSEVDEGLETLFFSEVINSYDIKTERALAIIEYKDSMAINVRVHENLLRPSHFFIHLKQNNFSMLENLFNYHCDREVKNKNYLGFPKERDAQLKYFLEKISHTFSHLSAVFEDRYIFCWLDWDGDNILMDGGILDYGSIRQFGLFHAEYRYDDDGRYSTNIKEQKDKARYIVQTFAQMVDYLETGKKKPIQKFANHWSLKLFDKEFAKFKRFLLLKKVGYTEEESQHLIDKHYIIADRFYKQFTYFERRQAARGMKKLPDGITRDAIFCMRDILRELPQYLLNGYEELSTSDFIKIIQSHYASKKDCQVTQYRKKKSWLFQDYFKKLIKHAADFNKQSELEFLLKLSIRSSSINRIEQVTGDSISHIVMMINEQKPRLDPLELHELCVNFSNFLKLDHNLQLVQSLKKKQYNLVKECFEIVREYREGI